MEGWCYQRLGKKQEAYQAYQRLRERSPETDYAKRAGDRLDQLQGQGKSSDEKAQKRGE
jgi:hypothetical protein